MRRFTWASPIILVQEVCVGDQVQITSVFKEEEEIEGKEVST